MRTSTAGLSILAGTLAFAGRAAATDLIVNGSFESGNGVGWVGAFGTYLYSEAYFAGPPIPASEFPGSHYSWRHGLTANDFSGPLTQKVSLTPTVRETEIDSGRGNYTFSAWLASWPDNPERPYVTVQFLDASQNAVGPLQVIDRTSDLGFVMFADGATVFDRDVHENYWGKYEEHGVIPVGARSALVSVTWNPTIPFSGRPDTYVDLVKLDVSGPVAPPSVLSGLPAGPGAPPNAVVVAVIKQGSVAIDPGTIQMSFDDVAVNPIVTTAGANTTLEYDPPGLLAPASNHRVRIAAQDGGNPRTGLTNEFTFSVIDYYNLLLPPPLYLETFESTDEGALPNGWSGVTYSAVDDPTPDLGNLNSASYAGWTVVNSARFNDPLLSYDSHTPTTDYRRVLSFNPANVVNGAIVPSLAQGKICFGNSGYRDGGYQVLYLFSPDFNLTGQTNVYLAFHSLWEQNQDSIAALEYSTDEGATWLPILYMMDPPDILRDANGEIDPVATMATPSPDNDIAVYIDPSDGQPHGGNYGAFIGVDPSRWSELGPYLSGRVNDNPVESKRVEVFRLPAADNQPKVRLRFAHAGTDSWYWGIDNVGLYSITTLTPPRLTGPTPAQLTDAAGNLASFSVALSGVGPFTYRWRRNGVEISGQTNSTLNFAGLQPGDQGSYEVIVGYVGGTVTSSPATLTVFTPPAASVIGQWEFRDLNLAATCGQDLEFFDLAVDLASGFGGADFFGLPLLDGRTFEVLSFPGSTANGGYKMRHGLSGNGGGTKVNQYTLIFDLLYPAAADHTRRTLLQTDPSNVADGSLRIDENNQIGVNGEYHGRIDPDTWYRLALAVDLVGPGPSPIVAKFINGRKVGQQILPEGKDGRWALSTSSDAPYALLFADNDVDLQPGYVSSIQLRNGRLSDTAIAAMGGPTADKIPGAACAHLAAGRPVINWSGTILEAADALGGPWTAVAGAAKPYPVPTPLAAQRFYRAR